MAQYPSAAGTDANLYIAKNNLSTALNGALNNSATTITVVDASSFPTTGYITIDVEAISYTGTTGTTFTGCTRGADGTTAASHLTAAQVLHTAVAAHHNLLKDEVKAVEGDLVGCMAAITPVVAASTSTSLLQRLAHIVSQIKAMTGLTNWYDAFTKFPISVGGTNSTSSLNNNRVMQSTGGAIVEASPITASRALVSDSNGIPTHSSTTSTELGYVAGATSALQTQLDTLAIGTIGRNRVINGEMKFSQSATSTLQTVNSNADFWPVDMFRCGGQVADGVYTVQQVTTTPPTGFLNYLHFVATTADASIGSTQIYTVSQAIEGNNCRDLLYGTANAKTMTLSFWVRSSLTGSFSGALSNSAVDRSYPFSYTISNANTWEQKTVTITGDTTGTWLTDNGIGIRIYFDLGAGTSRRASASAWAAGTNVVGVTGAVSLIGTLNATWDLTGVQFERGSNATPFEFHPYQTELLACQRYYEMSYEQGTALGTVTGVGAMFGSCVQIGSPASESQPYFFKTQKRATPTMTLYRYNASNTTGAWNWYSTSAVNTARSTSADQVNFCGFNVFQTAALDVQTLGQWVADARI